MADIEFLPGGFLTYWHGGAPLGCTVSQIALHHLPDFWKQIALLRIASMLSEGDKLCVRYVVYSFDPRSHEKYFEWIPCEGIRESGSPVCRSNSEPRAK